MFLSNKPQWKTIFTATLLATSIALVGCSDDDDKTVSQPPATQPPVNTSPSYVSETPYTAGTFDAASSINVMTYKMPYVTGKMENATAMIMMPKTAKPADGWRVVLWAHGTTGSGDACAPSKNPIGANFSVLAKSLLEQGYVIVAPDYEGLGADGIHPYLNLQSAAKSALYAMQAVKEKLGADLHGDWMSVGQSQGGHASLGIAEFAADDAMYKGAVAAAPASSLGDIITTIAPTAIAQLSAVYPKEVVASLYSDLLVYGAYTAIGIKAADPSYDYSTMFEPRAYEIAKLAEGTTGDNGLCLGDMNKAYTMDILKFMAENPTKGVLDYPTFTPNFEKAPVIANFLKTSQPGTKKLNKPVYVVQGKDDAAVPYQVTELVVKNLNLVLGSTPAVIFDVVEGKGHSEAIVERNPQVVEFIKTHMPPL